MPPKKAVYEDPPDMSISLRMKYGVHTLFLLVDPLAPFSAITTELFFALHDRSDQGLRATAADPPQPLPSLGKDVRVSYGVLKDPNDTSKGWKDLKIQGDETPASKGLKNNTIVAFVIRDVEQADEAPEFVVQWPRIEEEEEDDEDVEMEEAAETKVAGKRKAEAVDEDDDLDL